MDPKEEKPGLAGTFAVVFLCGLHETARPGRHTAGKHMGVEGEHVFIDQAIPALIKPGAALHLKHQILARAAPLLHLGVTEFVAFDLQARLIKTVAALDLEDGIAMGLGLGCQTEADRENSGEWIFLAVQQ